VSQLCARWIAPCHSDFAIYQGQRQAALARTLQKFTDSGLLGKGLRLMRQIETLNIGALPDCPLDITREGDKGLIHFNPANAGATAQGGIVYLDEMHAGSPMTTDEKSKSTKACGCYMPASLRRF